MDAILKYFTDFTPRQLQQLQELEGLYREWNEKINVISRKDIDGLFEKHVLHSLAIAAVFDFQPGQEIIDIGTGGGFPGIPLALFFPEVSFHLVDSIAKKLKVVTAVAEGIGLTNITTQHTRTEDIKDRKFDFAVSRAVAPLRDLWNWSRPLLKKPMPDKRPRQTGASGGGNHEAGLPAHKPGLICLKGGDLAVEIQESGTRPQIIEIGKLFPEPYFSQKYILYVGEFR